jgi:hypothetical protein
MRWNLIAESIIQKKEYQVQMSISCKAQMFIIKLSLKKKILKKKGIKKMKMAYLLNKKIICPPRVNRLRAFFREKSNG